MVKVVVFGLGEAGSLIAADLAGAGAEVHGYDPADTPTPAGVHRETEPGAAVAGVDLLMSVTAASDARESMGQAWDQVSSRVIYADLATASPQLKQELAQKAVSRDVPFADVALMAPVPGRGLSTPALVSGTGAQRFSDLVNELGGNVEVVGDLAGQAAARKLLRSIVTKGLTALLLEAMEAAEASGDSAWLWEHLVSQLTTIDNEFLERMVSGTSRHADRRLVEMESARAYLESLGVRSDMTEAVVERLHRIAGSPGI